MFVHIRGETCSGRVEIDAAEVFIFTCDAEQEGFEPFSGLLHGYEFGVVIW